MVSLLRHAIDILRASRLSADMARGARYFMAGAASAVSANA